jgi:hypothetical protein
MSVLVAILITVAVFVICIAISMAMPGEDHAEGVTALMVLASAIWASQDASRIGLKQYEARLARGPISVFFAMWILWFIAFPWYLVVRSKIKAGVMPEREHVGPSKSGSAINVIGWVCGVMVLVALVSAALFVGAGGSVKGIWQHKDSQVQAAEASPQAIAVPVASTTVDSASVNTLPAASVEPLDGTYVFKSDGALGELSERSQPDGSVYLKIGTANIARQSPSVCEFETDKETGNAKRVGNTVSWSGDLVGQCKLEITFSGNQATVKQDGECGCGMGITMDGTFSRAK